MRSLLVRRVIGGAGALTTMSCILLVLASLASAAPFENAGQRESASRAVPAPTIVREIVVRPSAHTSTAVYVFICVGGVVAMLGAAYLGARIAMRTAGARHAAGTGI
jgi:hypothetical protein